MAYTSSPIDISEEMNALDCLMARTTSLACLVSTVISHRKNTEKQALVVGTKQSKQAEWAVRAA